MPLNNQNTKDHKKECSFERHCEGVTKSRDFGTSEAISYYQEKKIASP